jgi:hypothetical protein
MASSTQSRRAGSRLLQRTVLTSVGVLLATLSLAAAAEARAFVHIKSAFLHNPVDHRSLVIGWTDFGTVPGQTDFELVPEVETTGFNQHWLQTPVGPNTYTFRNRLLNPFNGCLKTEEALPPSSFGPILLGDCETSRARWRIEFRGGLGEVLVNEDGGGHALSPSRAPLGGGEHRLTAVPAMFINDWAPLIGWTFEFAALP